MPKKRGAVVIGVNKTGGLPVLEASADGALEFAKWLTVEGFHVKQITDAQGPVTAAQIGDAIASFVSPGNYHQLVIYFSGHGYWKNDAELWLLTDAPADANAAVSWAETAEFAKDCGIPSVVMISDACRSIPNNPRALKVRGSIIFPNEDVQRARSKVDKFMAAAVGMPAYELPVGDEGKKANPFTQCFLRAFISPDGDMIQEITEDGETIKVIPNRRLGKYLRREVTRLLATANLQLTQEPDAEVLSEDDVYIGRVQSSQSRSPELPSDPRGPSGPIDMTGDMADVVLPKAQAVELRDVAATAFERALANPSRATAEEIRAIEILAQRSGFNDAVFRAGAVVREVTRLETETGFAILGAAVADAIVANGERPVIRTPGDGRNPAVIRIEPHLAPACTVMLLFANGRGTALPAMRGYIGHIVVEENRVVNVNYVPSDNSIRWHDYADRREQIERLRATAAAAVKFGVFRLDNKQEAFELANHIRVHKGLDPTLGLYAAYAYSEADRREDIDSVLTLMRQDLDCDLFDIAVLARKVSHRQQSRPPLVPFCPMLTQGWNLLRARGVELPKVLEDAQDELEQAVWTTFKPARARAIFDAIHGGTIQ